MKRAKEFLPVVTRIKLNAEQAVLYCSCYANGWKNPSNTDKGSFQCPQTASLKSFAYYSCNRTSSMHQS